MGFGLAIFDLRLIHFWSHDDEAFDDLGFSMSTDPTIDGRPVLIHADQDKDEVGALCNRLKEQGYETWLRSVDVLPGEIKQKKASEAIAKAPLVICCFSSKSVGQRGDFQRDLRRALSAVAEQPADQISLIPVRLDDCELPQLSFEKSGIELGDFESADLFQDDGFERLLRAVSHRLGSTKDGADDDISEDTAEQDEPSETDPEDRKREYEEQAERVRSYFQDEVMSKLEESREALNALDRGTQASELDVKARAYALTSRLLTMTAEDALTLLSNAYQRLERNHPKAAAVCCDITMLILPAVYDPDAVQDVQNQMTDDGVYFVRLQARSELVADLIVAAATGRPIKLKSPDRDGAWPKGGALKLDLLPIVDRSGLNAYLEAWDEYLWDKLGSDQHQFDRAERVQYLVQELGYRARRRTPPDVYYIILPEDEGTRFTFEAALGHLAKKYPDLLILALNQDRKLDLEETKKFRPLRDMLFRQGRSV